MNRIPSCVLSPAYSTCRHTWLLSPAGSSPPPLISFLVWVGGLLRFDFLPTVRLFF